MGMRGATLQNCEQSGRPLQGKADARVVKAPQLSGRHPTSGHHATCLRSFTTDVRWNSRTHLAADYRWPVASQDVRAPFSGALCLAASIHLTSWIVSIPHQSAVIQKKSQQAITNRHKKDQANCGVHANFLHFLVISLLTKWSHS